MVVKERLWNKDCEGKIVTLRLWKKDWFWKKDCERKIVKGRLKDRLRAKSWKKKPVEVWEVLFNHFLPFLLSKKNGLRTDRQTEWWADRQIHGWTCNIHAKNDDFSIDFAIFTKALPTDGPTDRRTDIPSYRDAIAASKKDCPTGFRNFAPFTGYHGRGRKSATYF